MFRLMTETTFAWEFARSIFERSIVTDFVETNQNDQSKAPELPGGAAKRAGGNWNIELLLDVELPVSVSFGSSEMNLRDVLKLGSGSVIELDKSVNDPVSIIVNRKPIAKGEVVMVDGNYGVRILEVESTAERIRSLA
jgi:flagellar motor switch protein FliN/FliY